MLRYMRENVKWIMITVILLFVVSCFAGYGLYSRSGNRGGGDGTSDYPVAEVDGREIMRSEIEKGLSTMAEQYSRQQELTSADLPVIRQMVLEGIVIQAEVEKEIKNKDIDITKDEINAAYARIMDSYPTREEFQAYLQRSGITEQMVKDDLKKQLQQQKLLESLSEGITISDTDAHVFYDTAKNILYKQPSGVKVNMATFDNTAAADLAQKAIAGGAAWDKIMAEQKAAVRAATSYDQPMLLTDNMMESGAFAKLKDFPLNKVTPVISITSNDSYIAIKRSKEATRVLSYNEVSADVMATLKNQKLQEKQNEYFTELSQRAKVEILDPTIFPAAPASADATEPKSGDKTE